MLQIGHLLGLFLVHFPRHPKGDPIKTAKDNTNEDL
jgi:hypothetical protein